MWTSMPFSAVFAPGAGMRRRTSALRERIMNGPLPVGWSAKAGVSASTASRGTMPRAGWPSTDGKLERGVERSILTTPGDRTVMPSKFWVVPSTLSALNPAMASSWGAAGELVSFRPIRSRVYCTSEAVIVLPLENLAGLRVVGGETVEELIDDQQLGREAGVGGIERLRALQADAQDAVGSRGV